MINKKSPAISDLPAERESLETRNDPEIEGSEKRPSIFVRLSPKAKLVLEEAAVGRTYAQVIERLLEHLRAQESEIQEKILNGILVNPLKESEVLLAQLSRGQHAYEEKRYYYAVKTYETLVNRLDGVESSSELLEFCNYRLGHCWISLAYDLRREAQLFTEDQESTRSDLYDIALEALSAALECLGRVKDDTGNLTNLIAHYNVACCFSLKAQYTVESKIDADSPPGRRLRKADPKDPSQTQEIWDDIGVDWRKKYGEDDNADDWAHSAMTELAKIYSKPTEAADSTDSVKFDTIWIVEMANRDPDFVFLRSDTEGWKQKFDEWSTIALPKDNSIAKAAGHLLRERRRRGSN